MRLFVPCCLIFVVLGAGSRANAQSNSASTPISRRGLFNPNAWKPHQASTVRPANQPTRPEGEEPSFASMFSIGTLFGLAYTPEEPSTYKIRDNVVVFDDERTKARPGTFMLPSLCLGGFRDRAISAIVPVNFNLAKQVDVGVGLSIGIQKGGRQDQKKKAEIGFAVAAVWSDNVRLSEQQKKSFREGTALPASASTDFRTAKRPGVVFGIYLTPIL